jgi:superfamily II DNA/RNA helicase
MLGLLLKLVKYDLSKKHSCLIFCNQTKTVRYLQHFFRDQRIDILVMHSDMTDTVKTSTLF